MILHPSHGKSDQYPDVKTQIISAVEIGAPPGREAIKWNFATNLPITDRSQSIQALEWYKQRRKIDLYFRIIKSGFKAEESKLRAPERITRLLSIFCILA